MSINEECEQRQMWEFTFPFADEKRGVLVCANCGAGLRRHSPSLDYHGVLSIYYCLPYSHYNYVEDGDISDGR